VNLQVLFTLAKRGLQREKRRLLWDNSRKPQKTPDFLEIQKISDFLLYSSFSLGNSRPQGVI